MEFVRNGCVWNACNILCVISQFLGILHRRWNFDGTTEAEVGVALLVDHLLNFTLGEVSGVHRNRVVNWQGSSCLGVVVRDHVEVKRLVAIVLNDTGVNNCSRAWIDDVAVNSLEEASCDSLVNENIQDLRVVVLVEPSNSLLKSTVWTLEFKNFPLVSWSSHSISEDDDLLRSPSIVGLDKLVKRILHEFSDDSLSLFAIQLLLLLF